MKTSRDRPVRREMDMVTVRAVTEEKHTVMKDSGAEAKSHTIPAITIA